MAKLEKAIHKLKFANVIWFSWNFHVLDLPKSAAKFFVYLHSKLLYLQGSHSLRPRILRNCCTSSIDYQSHFNIVMARLRTQLIYNQAFTNQK